MSSLNATELGRGPRCHPSPQPPKGSPRTPSLSLTSHAGQRCLEGAAFHRPLDHLLLLTLGRTRDPTQASRLQEPGLTLVTHQVLQKKAVLQRGFGGTRRLRRGAPGSGGRCRHECIGPGNPGAFLPTADSTGFTLGPCAPNHCAATADSSRSEEATQAKSVLAHPAKNYDILQNPVVNTESDLCSVPSSTYKRVRFTGTPSSSGMQRGAYRDLQF